MKHISAAVLVLFALVSACITADDSDVVEQHSGSGSAAGSGSGSAGSGSGSGSGSATPLPLPADDYVAGDELLTVPASGLLVDWTQQSGTTPIAQLAGYTLIDSPGLPQKIVANAALASEAIAARRFDSIECMNVHAKSSATSSTAMTPVVAEPPASWKGREHGGCAVFSTLQCDVRLGRRGTTVTEAQWNTLADKLDMDEETGGVTIDKVNSYYEEAGYCVKHYKRISLRRLCEEYRAGGDVKLIASAPAGSIIGHIMTVIGCDEHGLIVNQWGTPSRAGRFDGALGPVTVPNVLYDHSITDAYVYKKCPAKAGR